MWQDIVSCLGVVRKFSERTSTHTHARTYTNFQSDKTQVAETAATAAAVKWWCGRDDGVNGSGRGSINDIGIGDSNVDDDGNGDSVVDI